MQLILHPQVHNRYKGLRDASQLLDREDGAPLEFSHGAFRFGHAMVRNEYMINGDDTLGIQTAVLNTTHRSLGREPLGPEWLVDWARFFAPAGTGAAELPRGAGVAVNFAHKIGPLYTTRLGQQSVMAAKDPAQGQGLAFRDLRSAAYAGMWTVPALCDELRRQGFRDVVPEYAELKPQIANWLRGAFQDATAEVRDAAVDNLSNDPPLPFFVLYEAAHSTAPGHQPDRRLGPVGSILVAETIYGALLRHPIACESGPTLTQRIKNCCRALLDDPQALSRVPGQNPEMERNLEIESMPQLLQFMADNGAFPSGPPPA
jgi:hypothetical protein